MYKRQELFNENKISSEKNDLKEKYSHRIKRYLKYLLLSSFKFFSLIKVVINIISIKIIDRSGKNGPVAIKTGKLTINKLAIKLSCLIISV